MAKKNPLNAGLKANAEQKEKGIDNDKPVDTNARTGRVLVAGHFSVDVQDALRMIAAKERTTIQALLAEGLNVVFAKRGCPEIAASSNAQKTL